jgi:hypothetical protein
MMRQSREMTKWLEDLVERGLELFGGTREDSEMNMAGVKLRLKKDLRAGAYIGNKGDIFVMDPRSAEFLLKTKPQVWAKVREKKKKPDPKAERPVVPGAPPPNKAVDPETVAQRPAGAPPETAEA